MMSRVAREVAPCDQLQLIGDKLHELKRLLPILHFHSLLETVERTPVDPNGSDPELANTSDNGADGVSKPKSYLRLPEIPALVTSCDLRGSKALVLLGYRDCSYETHRYMVEVENLPEDDPLVLGLQQHLEQHWLQMDIHSLLKDGLKEESIEWNSDSTNNLPLSTDISNGTTAFSHIGQDSLDTDGGAQSRDNRKESRKHHLCHRQSLHRRHRHHPHQRSQQNHHHHHHRQSCSQCQATQRPHLLHEHQSFVKSLSRREELNTRVLRVSEENPSDPQRNGEEKTKTIKFEIQPVTSDILLSPSQSAASSSSSESEPDKAVDSCVQALLTPDNNNSLLVPNSPDNNNDNNNNNNDDDDDLEETSSNNEVSLKEEDPERWKQLNLSIARVTQELIVLLENEGSTLSEDEDEDGYEEEEESDDGGIVGDIDFNNILNQ